MIPVAAVLRKVIDLSLARFLVVGVANTIVGLAVILGAKALLGLDDVRANVLGYAIGLTVSFLLNKKWTFGFHGSALAGLLKFLLVFAIAYAANLITVLTLVNRVGLSGYLSQAAGILPYTTIFYAGSRWFAFNAAMPRT